MILRILLMAAFSCVIGLPSQAFAIDFVICWREPPPNGPKKCEPPATAVVPPEAKATIEIMDLTGSQAKELSRSLNETIKASPSLQKSQ
jgi:hypothetical protein